MDEIFEHLNDCIYLAEDFGQCAGQKQTDKSKGITN